MLKYNEIKVLTFGDKAIPVENAPQNIQALIPHYNQLLKDEADFAHNLLVIQLAKKQIELNIESLYLQDEKAKAEASEDAKQQSESECQQSESDPQ